MKQNHNITKLEKLTKKAMKKYFVNNFKNKSNRTKEIAYYYLKSFFNWCIENHYIISSPINKIKSTKTIKNRALSQQQIETIVNQIDTEDFYGIQNRCIVELSYATAIRINELIQLNLEDIDLGNRQ